MTGDETGARPGDEHGAPGAEDLSPAGEARVYRRDDADGSPRESSVVPPAEVVEQRARKLAHGGEGAADLEEDPEKAARAARAILEESEARLFDPATIDPDHDGVIRRSSDETASRGDRH